MSHYLICPVLFKYYWVTIIIFINILNSFFYIFSTILYLFSFELVLVILLYAFVIFY